MSSHSSLGISEQFNSATILSPDPDVPPATLGLRHVGSFFKTWSTRLTFLTICAHLQNFTRHSVCNDSICL